MGMLWQDVKYGARMLLKDRGVTLVAVLTLALGIGANTVIFSAVNSLVLHPTEFVESDRLVQVWEGDTRRPEYTNEVAPANFFDWRREQKSFEDLTVYHHAVFNWTGAGEPQRLPGANVLCSFFPLLRVQAAKGRVFLRGEDQEGAERVVIVSEGFWRQRLGGDLNVLEKPLTLNGEVYSIVGVLPESFHLPHLGNAEIFTPLKISARSAARRRSHWMYVLGRLKPGVTLQQARGEMTVLGKQLEQQYPQDNASETIRVIPLNEQVASFSGPALLLLLVAVGFVLLIACANVANLLLARASSRQREMAIRAAMGAGRVRLVRQLLAESLLLGLVAGIAGLLLSLWGKDLLAGAIPSDFSGFLPHRGQISTDAWVLGFTAGISFLTSLLFGIAPALHASSPDLHDALKESGGRVAGQGRHRLRNILVVSEVALALVLLAGAGLMLKSIIEMQRVNPGFHTDNLLTMEVSLPQVRYPKDEDAVPFFRRAIERVSALPSVEGAAAVSNIPFGGSNASTAVRVAGRAEPLPGEALIARIRIATPRYFEAMRIPLHKGRTFTDDDTAATTHGIVISDALAERLFHNEDPIGQKLIVELSKPTEFEVIGVVGNVMHESLREVPQEHMYLAHAQAPEPFMVLVVRTSGDPERVTTSVRKAIWEVDKDEPVANVATMEHLVNRALGLSRVSTILLGVFGVAALLLAALGIYGVMSYAVTQRTHEIGVRMALGAQRADVLRMVLGDGLKLVGVGMGVGTVLAIVVTFVMREQLFGVSPSDPGTYAGIALLLTLVAVAASYVPARRAAKVEPITALRYE